jgi:hypothetical protein
LSQFAALIAVCGNLLQREQQPGLCIGLAVKQVVHWQVKQ